jgi:hypothetical protein
LCVGSSSADSPCFPQPLRPVCSHDPKAKKLQLEEAARLHLALSPECAVAREHLAAMQSRNSHESARSIEQQRRLVATNCPVVDAKDRWRLQWDGRSVHSCLRQREVSCSTG